MATLWTGSQSSPTTPGSIASRAAGCTCDVYLNQSGRGLVSGMKDVNGRPVFVVATGCGQHAVTDVGALGAGGTVVPQQPVAQMG